METTPNRITLPVFEVDESGNVLPNPAFHRSWDKLHSRCIEYPYAASKLSTAKRVLDVGTAKADEVWVKWLEKLPMEVHATDFDVPSRPFTNLTFHRADVRSIPLPDAMFDKILAVSVIEHIGLEQPQVESSELPAADLDGDLVAVRELARLLKPGGELVMTLPLGLRDGLILGGQARCYSARSISKFEKVLPCVELQYYEYQHKHAVRLFPERPGVRDRIWHLAWGLGSKLGRLKNKEEFQHPDRAVESGSDSAYPPAGLVTWRRVPITQCQAMQKGHTDGIACGIWRKHAYSNG